MLLLEFDPTKNTEMSASAGSVSRGSPRWTSRVLGTIDRLLHAAVITPRGDKIRVISLRRANRREGRAYAKERQSS